MPAAAREFFTVDLRGLRAVLSARAVRSGLSESDVLRSVLATALADEVRLLDSDQTPPSSELGGDEGPAPPIKLSTRLPPVAAYRLTRNARAAGLSRGAYLARLIEGAPPVMAAADRKAGFAALSASAAELALLSRDINTLARLLSRGAVQAALQYRDKLDTLDAEVQAHLDKAAAVLTELSAVRVAGTTASRTSPLSNHHHRKTP